MDSSGVMTTFASPKMKNEDSLEVAKTSASPEMGKIAHLGCCENSVKSELRMPRRFPQICIYIYCGNSRKSKHWEKLIVWVL